MKKVKISNNVPKIGLNGQYCSTLMLIMSLIFEILHIFLFIDFLLIWDIPCG
jgi:hypothetical protein